MFNTLIFLAFLCREQPLPRGCVLKRSDLESRRSRAHAQPLPRGCVLKHGGYGVIFFGETAAASARLCVETLLDTGVTSQPFAAASARLCVETPWAPGILASFSAAASARLCVETNKGLNGVTGVTKAAASARLCVETTVHHKVTGEGVGSRLRAAVC